MQLKLFKDIYTEKRDKSFRVQFFEQLFEDHYIEALSFQETCIEAIKLAYYKNHWLHEQSEESFQRTLRFYSTFIKYTRYVSIHSVNIASYVFTMAYLFGEYTKQKRCALEEVFRHWDGELNQSDVVRSFELLFCKWETPEFLTYNLTELDDHMLDALMFHLRGENIRKHPSMDLSKKEAYTLIYKLPLSLEFGDNVGYRATIVAKILAVNVDAVEVIVPFISENRQFYFAPEEVDENLEHWKQLFKFLTTNDRLAAAEHRMQEMLDFYTAAIPEGFRLSGRTMASFNRAITAWHNRWEYEEDFEELEWEEKVGVMKLTYGKEEWRIVELTSSAALNEEANIMSHCVFSYAAQCMYYGTIIFSVQRFKETWQRMATAEWIKDDFVQIKGKHNQMVTQPVNAVLGKFAALIPQRIKFKEEELKKEEGAGVNIST